MAGEQLHKYDLDLCNYAVSSIGQHLLGAARPPARAANHRRDWWSENERDFPTWFSGQLPAALEDYVWPGPGDVARLPLNDDELNALALAAVDPPRRFQCFWEPYPALHRRRVLCVREIRAELTRQDSEEWSEACAGFAARLSQDRLPIASGIDIVHEWLWHLRRLLRAMGATRYLPYPLGRHPTPTIPDPPTDGASAGGRLAQPTNPKELAAISKMRALIARVGADAMSKTLVREAECNRQAAYRALRYLESSGEYHGFQRRRARRYAEGRPNER